MIGQNHFHALRIVFAGGGTGGHLYPAIAIAQAFERRCKNFEAVFIGSDRGLEARVVPSLGYRLELLPVRGLLRKLTLSNLLVPIRMVQSVLKCQRLFKEFEPHLIVGTGGYVSGPALMAAWLSGRKFVIQEQNSFPGLTNRKFGDRAHALFLSFEESRRFFKRKAGVHIVGNPVRQDLKQHTRELRRAAAQKWNLIADRTTLFVFGGSQGARRINQIITELLPQLAGAPNFQILWATGPANFEQIAPLQEKYSNIRPAPYIDDMNLAYALSDFAVCRSGASTIFELALCGLPAILIPLPTATADHQTFNARVMENAGAAFLFKERELAIDRLLQSIRDLATNMALRQRMSEAAARMARPNAAEEIVTECLRLVQA